MFSQKSVLLATLALTSTVFAVDTTSTYLPNIVNAITTGCTSACTPFENAITACVSKFTAPLDLATCSCSATFLSSLFSCAVCEDAATPGGAQQKNYNGFQQQCVSAALATGAPAAFPAGSGGTAATGGAASGSAAATVAPIVVATTAAPTIASTITSIKPSSVSSVTSSAVNLTASAKPTSGAHRVVSSSLLGMGFVAALLL